MCSKYSIELPAEFGYSGEQRVCLDCYQALSKINPASGPIKNNKHLSTLVSQIDRQNPEDSYKEGFLVKKGHRRRNWNRRFFVLNKGVLYYFSEDSLTKENTEQSKGSIILKDYMLAFPDEKSTSYKYCFLLENKQKDFVIRAENQAEFDSWVDVISLLVKGIGRAEPGTSPASSPRGINKGFSSPNLAGSSNHPMSP